ncbi:MAG TPA: hypothetical protein VFO27_02745 [Bryobacteraceae bacterium]|nr:hypothetical protein [Bryobacteraceae bacterium]
MKHAIGVDVGGTKIAAAVVDSEGNIGPKTKTKTGQGGSDRPGKHA